MSTWIRSKSPSRRVGLERPRRNNLGHFYEAAAAHFEATGKTNLLHVALRSADLVASVWGKDKLEIPFGHREIEIGLVKLYRVTRDEKYLNLAKFLLDCRGNGHCTIPPGHYSARYYSDHLPVTKQTEAVGHSICSTYMCSGMADVAAIKGDSTYAKAIGNALWNQRMFLLNGDANYVDVLERTIYNGCLCSFLCSN